MRRPTFRFARRPAVLLLFLGGLLTGSVPSPAEVGPPPELRRSVEVAIGPLHEGSLLAGDELILALRATWRFSNPWAIELAVGEHREDRFRDAEATTVELGLRRSLVRNDVVDFFVYGGAGYADGVLDVWFQPPGPQGILVHQHAEEDSWTGHLGLGVEISLGERWFLRTDLRERYLGEIELLDTVLEREATISWGWRF